MEALALGGSESRRRQLWKEYGILKEDLNKHGCSYLSICKIKRLLTHRKFIDLKPINFNQQFYTDFVSLFETVNIDTKGFSSITSHNEK